jgi:L-galactose dehydrogenase
MGLKVSKLGLGGAPLGGVYGQTEQYMKTELFDSIQFYARYMLIDHTAKDEVLPLAKEMGIGVMNGSVLGMGFLADAPAHFLEEENQVDFGSV